MFRLTGRIRSFHVSPSSPALSVRSFLVPFSISPVISFKAIWMPVCGYNTTSEPHHLTPLAVENSTNSLDDELYSLVKEQKYDEAVETITTMLSANQTLSTNTLNEYINTCNHPSFGEKLQEVAEKGDLPNDLAIALVFMHLRCGNLENAKRFYKQKLEPLQLQTNQYNELMKSFLMKKQTVLAITIQRKLASNNSMDIYSWRIIIEGMAKNHQPKRALEFWKEMLAQAIKPDAFTVASILFAASEIDNNRATLDSILSVVDENQIDIENNIKLANQYLRAMFRCCEDEAMDLFRKMKRSSVMDGDTWGVVFSILVELKNYKLMFGLWEDMKKEHVEPNEFVVSTVLSAASIVGNGDVSLGICEDIVSFKAAKSPEIQNHLLGIYCQYKELSLALSLFDEIKGSRAVDVVTWGFMIGICKNCDQPAKALELWDEMISMEVVPTEIVATSALSAALALGDKERALNLCTYVHQNVPMDNKLQNQMLNTLCKYDQMPIARKIFKRLKHFGQDDIYTWSVMIGGYAKNHPKVALNVWDQLMAKKNMPPNRYAVLAVLNALADESIGKQKVEHICNTLKRNPFLQKTDVQNQLLRVHCSHGNTETAFKYFHQLRERKQDDHTSWNIMIAGVGKWEPNKGFEIFNEMIKSSKEPNDRTLMSLLQVCQHAKSPDKALKICESLKTYVKPNKFHISCLIAILKEAGRDEDVATALAMLPETHSD